MRRIAFLMLAAACSVPRTPVGSNAPRALPPAHTPQLDDRLAALAAQRESDVLPTTSGIAATPPADAVVVDATRPPARPATQPILVWAAADAPIQSLQALPSATPVYLAARSRNALVWVRARALEQPRCVAWLEATGAKVGDVARALGPETNGDTYDVSADPRLCGVSWRERVETLASGGGSLFVHVDERTCAQLTFDRAGDAIRASFDRHPRLRFAITTGDGTIAMDGPIAEGDGNLRCAVKDLVTGEDATSIAVEGADRSIIRKARLFYTETACLAASLPDQHDPDCLRSVLASTSTRDDAVVDRVAPIAARHGALYDTGGCHAQRFAVVPEGSKSGYQYELRYVAQNAEIEGITWEGPDVAIGRWSAPVVETDNDFVLVDGVRWYFDAKACRAAQ